MDGAYNRDWLTKEEAESFIGENSFFYLEKWKSHSDSSLKGWNWAAMFFGIRWLVYRRMYREAILYSLAISVFAIFLGLFLGFLGIYFNDSIFEALFNLTYCIMMGVFGNAIYRKKALRVLRKNIRLNDIERLTALKNAGGVSVLAVIVSILLEIAIGFLIVFLL